MRVFKNSVAALLLWSIAIPLANATDLSCMDTTSFGPRIIAHDADQPIASVHYMESPDSKTSIELPCKTNQIISECEGLNPTKPDQVVSVWLHKRKMIAVISWNHLSTTMIHCDLN